MREGFCQADCGYLVFYEQTGFCHMFRRLHVPDIHNLVTVSRELLEVSLWSLIVPQCPTFNACSHVHTAHSSVCNPVLLLNHLLSNTFITFVTFVWFGPIWGVVNSSCLLAMVLFSWRGSDEKIGPARNWYSAQKLHQWVGSWKWKEQDWKKLNDSKGSAWKTRTHSPSQPQTLNSSNRFPIVACSFSNAQDSVALNRQSYCKNSKWNHAAMRICIFHTFDWFQFKLF